MNLAPILVSVYDRLDHFKQCIEKLKSNDLAKYSEIFIASDGPVEHNNDEIIKKIRNYIDDLDGFKNVVPIIRQKNFGAFNNIVSAFNHVINKKGRIIFLEDDIMTSPNFLTYMNEALDFYENDNRILAITGYSPPLQIPRFIKINNWMSKRHCTWGFGTWKEKWNEVNIDDFNRYEELLKMKNGVMKFNYEGNDMSEMLKNDSIGIYQALDMRICYHLFMNNQFTVYPSLSKTNNIGFDGSGLHCGKSDYYVSKLDQGNQEIQFDKYMVLSPIIQYLHKCFIENKNVFYEPIKSIKKITKRISHLWKIC